MCADKGDTNREVPRPMVCGAEGWGKLASKGKAQTGYKRRYGMSIEQQPEKGNRCEELGHWEIDTAMGNPEALAIL